MVVVKSDSTLRAIMTFHALYTDLSRNGITLSSKSLSFEISLGLLKSRGRMLG
jgi:hypothetical protein